MRVTAVSRIVRLRHPGVLRNFTWAMHLPTFGRYNLIYGWKGSGKTTLSKMFRALEMRTAPSIGDVTISIAGANLSGEDFSSATLPVRVFNRDFVVESVFPIRRMGNDMMRRLTANRQPGQRISAVTVVEGGAQTFTADTAYGGLFTYEARVDRLLVIVPWIRLSYSAEKPGPMP